MRWLISLLLCFSSFTCHAKILNIYAWSGEIPDSIIRQFEKATGIKVNIATYDNNEIMYAKLRAMKNGGYDLIIPSSYFVERMRRQNMLEKLDKSKLTHLTNLNPEFTHPSYDPNIDYSVPYLWGVTGIFYNNQYYPNSTIKKWNDLWEPRFKDRLMLLDDTREVFSIALLSMGYQANDNDPVHIEEAYLKLKKLMENVKVFSSDTVVSIIIDEDATIGTAWNGDVYKALQENPAIQFVLPEEGFVIWVDNLCIPKNAPHKTNAYAFIDFVLQAEIGKDIALKTRYPTTNLAAQKLLPEKIRTNPVAYPPKEVMKHGQFQRDLGEETLVRYEKYWEQLKISG